MLQLIRLVMIALRTHYSAPNTASGTLRPRRGFTMAEMLVIIGIILLVMALALPAFTVIMGSRSVEAGRNVVAASIARARGEAIRRGQPCGVFFYIDPDTNRTGVAIVTLDPLTDLDHYDEYKSFTRGNPDSVNPTGLPVPLRDYQGGSYDPLNVDTAGDPPPENEPSMTADRAVVLGSDANAFYGDGDPTTFDVYEAFHSRPIVVTLMHKSGDLLDGSTNPGLLNPGDETGEPEPVVVTAIDSSFAPSMENEFWAFDEIGSLELIDGIETELLAPGVGLQVILGQALEGTADDGAADEDGFKYSVQGPGAAAIDAGYEDEPPYHPPFLERYARAGLILFDEEGHLVQEPYRIYASSRLGRVMGLELVRDPLDDTQPSIQEYRVPAEGFPVVPVLGVALYNRDDFENAASDGTSLVWKGGFIASIDPAGPPTTLDDFTTSEGDVTFLYPPADRPSTIMAPPAAGDWRFHEYAEERWLDASTIPLMVNRYSGMLVEAE